MLIAQQYTYPHCQDHEMGYLRWIIGPTELTLRHTPGPACGSPNSGETARDCRNRSSGPARPPVPDRWSTHSDKCARI